MQWSSDYDWDELPGPSQKSDIPKLMQSKKKKKVQSHKNGHGFALFGGRRSKEGDENGLKIRKNYVETKFCKKNKLPLRSANFIYPMWYYLNFHSPPPPSFISINTLCHLFFPKTRGAGIQKDSVRYINHKFLPKLVWEKLQIQAKLC